MELRIASLGTGVIADGAQVEFHITPQHFRGGSATPELRINGLVAAEVITVWKKIGGIWAIYTDTERPPTDVVINATIDHAEFHSLGYYGITKNGTAAIREAWLVY
jgi:hypothetical protein